MAEPQRTVLSTRPVAYGDGALQMEGVLAYDDSSNRSLPGLLLIHGGAGLDAHAREQAARYATLGYAVLAADMFGPGVAGSRDKVMATVSELRDNPDTLVRRARAAIAALTACPEATGCLAAVGFCFGGMAVLELARAGTQLAGVISIHGSLASSRPATAGAIKSRLLVCHGAADPHVPLVDVASFVDEMDTASADWQMLMLGGAVHGFTHRSARPGATPGVAYNEQADGRSFAAARLFLAELDALN
jgi:dienelactone hydrolase